LMLSSRCTFREGIGGDRGQVLFLAEIFSRKDADRGGVCKKQDPKDVFEPKSKGRGPKNLRPTGTRTQ
jgi:hypothetical protein